jgi:hypothetical protein
MKRRTILSSAALMAEYGYEEAEGDDILEEVENEEGTSAVMLRKDLENREDYGYAASEFAVECEPEADVSDIQTVIFGKIEKNNKIFGTDYISDKELMDRLDRMKFPLLSALQEWEFFYRGLGLDRFFEEQGDIYHLPVPKVTNQFMDELERAYKNGDVDLIMIDDARISDDDLLKMAFFDFAKQVKNFGTMAHLTSVELLNILPKLRSYFSYAPTIANYLGKDDDQGVRLIGVNTQKKQVEQVWDGINTLEKSLPNKPYYELMSVGTLIRLSYYLFDYRTLIHDDIDAHDKYLSFLLGEGRKNLYSPCPVLLNHFDINGNVVVARGTCDNKWNTGKITLFTPNETVEKVSFVNVPVILNSGGSHGVDYA